MRIGKYIVLEGIDGSGKSTVGKKIAGRIYQCVLTCEPTETEIGKLLQQKLVGYYDFDNKIAEAERDFALFTADRIEHHQRIKEELKVGNCVLSSRSYYSSIAYQGVDGADIPRMIQTIDYLKSINLIRAPDVAIVIDLPPEEAIKRIEERTRQKFENVETLNKVCKIYDELESYFPKENIRHVDGTLNPTALENTIMDVIKSNVEIVEQS